MDRLSTKGQMIDQIDLSGVPHSGFDRSNHNYGTGKLGAIIPTRLDEVYPGDRIKGVPTTVANFEPLAAPLMGSMVMKQESFFVPLPQVWKHAYKFFTGKNGFNEQMPSMSPHDIYMVYSDFFMGDLFAIGSDNGIAFDVVVKNLSSYYNSGAANKTYHSVNETYLYDDVQTVVSDFYGMLRVAYYDRKMMDLVLPLYNDIKKFCESDYVRNLSLEFEKVHTNAELLDLMHDFCAQLGQQMEKILLFFFGPSSLFDYIGWPIVVPKNLQVTENVGGVVITRSIFYDAIASNVFNTYGSDTTLNTNIGDLFSNVPLVFLPFKANYLVWYWNYRDQLLETGILDPEDDEFLGSEITDNVVIYCTLMRQRCWFKDAYTTALTNTGDGNLLVPTGFDSEEIHVIYYDSEGNLINTTDRTQAFNSGATVCEVQNGNYSYKIPMNYLVGAQTGDYADTSIYGDSNFLSLDLFERVKRLRSVIQKRLILGYEVDDVIWSSFMVRLSNVRMHVPELLGRGRDSVDISTVVNNTSTDQQIAGDKTAIAWSKGSISDVDYFAEEWGFYLQYLTILPIQSYAGGMQRLYIKRDPLDWMWPEFATMGMDAVYNFELAAFGTHLSDADGLKVFGYNGRYYDLKYRQDEEHGRLLTDLNYLTFSREFDEVPKLNYMFVHCWPRLDGFVIESPLEDVFRFDCYTAQGWERRLPVPSNIVH